MQIQVNSDHNIESHEAMAVWVRSQVESALGRIRDHITRVEVHLRDENGPKGGSNDIRCVMEARIEGHQPVAVTQQAATLEEAVEGAADKLARLIEHAIERLRDQKNHRTDPSPPEPGDD